MSALLTAITRDDVASYVNSVFIVYIIIIFVWVLASWVPRMPNNRALRAVLDFVNQVTLPYISVFRRVLPPIGPLDLSPIVAVIVLVIARRVVVGLIAG
jgi:YggT family protein